MRSSNKKKFYLAVILLSVVIGIISVTLLFYFNWNVIVASYLIHEGSLGVVLIISSRIIIVSGMATYTFYKWFKQEEQYLSDLPFLFGLFFLFLVFGKALDLFNDFIYFQWTEALVLLIHKIRFFIMILNFLPMIYLSSEMILFSFSLRSRFNKLTNEDKRNKISLRFIIIMLMIESLSALLAPSSRTLSIYYPIIIIPSLITIVWLFSFAFRNKRLSQVNTLILTFGFGAYLVSQTIRPLAQIMIGESPIFLIFAETIDLLVFLIIFLGFYKESKY
jgi:hypothetical protein